MVNWLMFAKWSLKKVVFVLIISFCLSKLLISKCSGIPGLKSATTEYI